jgi:hypothetical protein
MGLLRSFFRRRYQNVKAVDDINFQIEAGEVVGFLGPNGAGKTTTLKVLSGLLHPTAGRARILGFTPHERKSPFLKQITLVMGQKNQLNWDLPAMESFIVNQAIYDIPADAFRQTLAELTKLLDLEPLIDKQVRKLSLGELSPKLLRPIDPIHNHMALHLADKIFRLFTVVPLILLAAVVVPGVAPIPPIPSPWPFFFSLRHVPWPFAS